MHLPVIKTFGPETTDAELLAYKTDGNGSEHIQTLQLVDCEKVTVDGLHHVLIPRLSHIRQLHVKGCTKLRLNITFGGAYHRMTSLQELSIVNCELTHDDVITLCTVIR